MCRLSLVDGELGLLFAAVHGLLIVLASLVEHRQLGVWASVVVTHGTCWFTACGIFSDQGWNPCSLHWQVDSYRHQRSPVLFSYTSFIVSFYTCQILYIIIRNVKDYIKHKTSILCCC